MITVLAYYRLLGNFSTKILAFFDSLQKRFGESTVVSAVYANNRDEFIDLLRLDACAYARIALVRFHHFDSERCEPRVYVQAYAYTSAKRDVVYLVEPPIALAVDAPKEACWYAESQARAFGRFLKQSGINPYITDEHGYAINLDI